MARFKDISNQKFGRLTVLYKLHNYHKQGAYWLCICDCGNLTEVKGAHLRDDDIKSCGCLRGAHHKSNTRLHNIWCSMRQRCYNENSQAYGYYGSRGIVVCDEWKHDFMNFYNWAMDNGYKENLTIDRIDPNGNYEPSNCRWLTNKEQQRNKRNNKNFTYKGDTHCLSKWCEILGLNYKRVKNRINNCHWSIEQALELEERHHD